MKGTEFTVRGEVHINCGEHTGEMDMKSRQRFQLGYLHISNTSSHSHQQTKFYSSNMDKFRDLGHQECIYLKTINLFTVDFLVI